MRLVVKHVTRYTYEQPIAHMIQQLRLTPHSQEGQEILSWTVTVPGLETGAHYTDGFGNQQLGMPTGHEQQEIGEIELLAQPRRQGVALEMVHRDQWLARTQSEPLGRHQRGHNPADQTGTRCRSHRVQRVQRQAGLGKRRGRETVHRLGMGPRCDLGNHAPEGRMGLCLAEHEIGQHLDPAVGMTAQDRSSALVAARLQTEHGEFAWLRGCGCGG